MILFCTGVLLVFWALGAYNRLVRLRAHVARTLQTLANQWRLQAAALSLRLEQYAQGTESESQWAMLGDDALRWRPLTLSARQFLTCLTVLEAHPQRIPSVDDAAAVRAARDIFESHWLHLQVAQDDLAGAPVPADLQILWIQHEPVAQDKLRTYNAAVQSYHQAIGQFPALLLAWIFGFVETGEL